MKIIILSQTEKHFKKLPKIDQFAIAKKIRSLKERGISNEEGLQGYKDVYRVRAGNYRIVYRKTSDKIYIILIRHRKEIYELLKKLLG